MLVRLRRACREFFCASSTTVRSPRSHFRLAAMLPTERIDSHSRRRHRGVIVIDPWRYTRVNVPSGLPIPDPSGPTSPEPRAVSDVVLVVDLRRPTVPRPSSARSMPVLRRCVADMHSAPCVGIVVVVEGKDRAKPRRRRPPPSFRPSPRRQPRRAAIILPTLSLMPRVFV